MNEPKKVHPLTDHELIVLIREFNDEDALITLMNRYLPLVKSLTAKCYARCMDFEDWKQEASLILVKIIRRYKLTKRINFGAYYRSCLRNRFYDLIRKQSAKKRIPNNNLTSYSANQAYYDDTLCDVKATHPERSILITEALQKLLSRCSNFERKVIMGSIIKCQSFETIARRNHCSISKVKNASERYHRKYRQMRNNGLD